MATIKVKKLGNLWSKSKGLIGKEEAMNVYFETRWGIHTFFLKFPIDVLVLDNYNNIKNCKTVDINRIFLWSPIYCKVVELPKGSIKELKLKKNETVKLEFI